MNSTLPSAKAPDQPRHRSVAHRLLREHSPVQLLVALALLFVSTPFIQDLPHGGLVDAALYTLVMAFAVLAVGGRKRSLFIALLLVTPALLSKWIHHLRPDLMPPAASYLAATVFFGFVVGNLVRFIVRAPRVDANVLCAGIAGFLMLGLLWTPLYLAVAALNPVAFALPLEPGAGDVFGSADALYFSFSTLCTVGYGDVTPVSRVARMLAMTEAITGLFYMAVLISRLVSIYSPTRPVRGAAPGEELGKTSPK